MHSSLPRCRVSAPSGKCHIKKYNTLHAAYANRPRVPQAAASPEPQEFVFLRGEEPLLEEAPRPSHPKGLLHSDRLEARPQMWMERSSDAEANILWFFGFQLTELTVPECPSNAARSSPLLACQTKTCSDAGPSSTPSGRYSSPVLIKNGCN
jgi:hypothetical protein